MTFVVLSTQIGKDAMPSITIRSPLSLGHRFLTSRLAVSLFSGAAVAVLICLIWTQWIVSLGTSPSVLAAIGIGTFIAGMVGQFLPGPTSELRRSWSRLSVSIALLTWCWLTPRISAGALDWLLSNPSLMDNSPLFGLCCTAFAVIGLPALAAGWMFRLTTHDQHDNRLTAGFFAGASLGVGLGSLVLALFVGPQAAALILLSLSAIILTAHGLLLRNSQSITSTSGSTRPVQWNQSAFVITVGRIASIAFLAGISLGLLSEYWLQLAPSTVYNGFATAIGLLLGTAIAFFACKSSSSDSPNTLGMVLLASMPIALLFAFPWVIQCQLWLNSTVSSPNWMTLIRFMPLFLVSCAAAAVAFRRSTQSKIDPRLSLALTTSLFAFGFCVAVWALPIVNGPVPLAIANAVALAVTCLGQTSQFASKHLTWPRRRFQLASVFSTMIVVGLVTHAGDRYSPERAARVLFNTQAFAAHASGMSFDLLPYLDEGRLSQRIRGSRGVLTTWVYAGKQLQIRENGIPKGVVSTDVQAFPRNASDTLQVVLPLTLHAQPSRMMLLGVGTGEALSVAMKYPLQSVVVCDADRELIDIARAAQTTSDGQAAWESDKLVIRDRDGMLALASEEEPCDVIVSSPDPLALISAQWSATREFYALVRRKLTTDGIFCQRIQAYDLGPVPLQVITQTLQQEFADVLLVEAVAGEFLFVATNSEQGMFRGKLTRRLESTHVNQVLGESGVDWSAVLNLPAVENGGLAEFSQTAGPAVNSATNSMLPLGIPREVIRWGQKMHETHVALNSVGGRMLSWLPPDSSQPVLLRRLGEVQAQQDLMSRYSSQYWAYRATLKEHASTRSRSKVQSVTLGEKRRLHSEDRRRLAYFQALGTAVKTRSAVDIQKLADFAIPYDPLVSFFVHQEAAELYRMSPERDTRAELGHRLHATWFSSIRDVSLRNALMGLEILREFPEASESPQQRWDTMNALMQALQRRWEARFNVKPSTARGLVRDADQTLLAIGKALATMDQLASDPAIQSTGWSERKDVIDRKLVRLVKNQKSQWLSRALHSQQESRSSEQPDTESADTAASGGELPSPEVDVPTAPSEGDSPASDVTSPETVEPESTELPSAN